MNGYEKGPFKSRSLIASPQMQLCFFIFCFLLCCVVLTGGAEFDWILIPARFLVLDNIDIGRVCGLWVVCSAKIKYCRIVLSLSSPAILLVCPTK